MYNSTFLLSEIQLYSYPEFTAEWNFTVSLLCSYWQIYFDIKGYIFSSGSVYNALLYVAYTHQHGVRCIRLVETMIQSFKPEEIVILSSSFWIPFRLWLQREKSRRYFFYQASSKVSQSIGSFPMTKYFGCYILLQEVKELLMLAVFKDIILYLYLILTYFLL